MMKRILWGLMASVLWFGCKSGVPKDIINRDVMQNILFDMHLVDGYLSTIYVQDSAKKVGAAYYKGIYKKYDIDSATYNKSLAYYYKDAEVLQDMYKAIDKKLSTQKKMMHKTDSLLQKKAFIADSIKIKKKFRLDSLAIRKKMKPDSLSKAKAEVEIKKKKTQADSLLSTKRNSDLHGYNKPTLVE